MVLNVVEDPTFGQILHSAHLRMIYAVCYMLLATCGALAKSRPLPTFWAHVDTID